MSSLKNYADGLVLAPQVSFNNGSATPVLNNQVLTAVPSGSDAYNEFNGAVGLNGLCNWATTPITLTFSVLDSTKRYDVVIYSTRGFESSSYSNRYTDVAISSVGVFTNASSAGVTVFTTSIANDSARISSGNVDGKVFKFKGIDPGGDGSIVFTFTPGGTNGQTPNGYINAIKLVENGMGAGSNDSDGDSIPDAWEQLYFGGATNASPSADSDGDHISNLLEYIAGCDPTSANSWPSMSIAPNSTNALQLGMQTASNRLYTVEYTIGLTPPVWSVLTNLAGDGAYHTFSASTNTTPKAWFYRFRARLP